MEKAYLVLGSNVGDRMAYLQQAITQLSDDNNKLMRLSSVYESEPWGFDHPDYFLNQAVALLTSLDALELLKKLHEIEHSLGRVRVSGKYQARTIDLDIILFGNQTLCTPELTIPHPYMAQRMFVLQPLMELIPETVHPCLHRTIKELTEQCPDKLQVKRWPV
jgi:2-amino-4-hydroxy-6-hydroxymethyldihydropteridine diphosphokinase